MEGVWGEGVGWKEAGGRAKFGGRGRGEGPLVGREEVGREGGREVGGEGFGGWEVGRREVWGRAEVEEGRRRGEGEGANLWPKFWPKAFGPQRGPPKEGLRLELSATQSGATPKGGQRVGPTWSFSSPKALALQKVGPPSGAQRVGQRGAKVGEGAQSIRALVGGVGGRRLAGGTWREGRLLEGGSLGKVGGPKAWREKGGVGARRLHRPTPYVGPPPPLLARARARVEGPPLGSAQPRARVWGEGRLAPLARARGGARHWRHLLSRAPCTAQRGEAQRGEARGCASKKKGPGRTLPRAQSLEPRA